MGDQIEKWRHNHDITTAAMFLSLLYDGLRIQMVVANEWK